LLERDLGGCAVGCLEDLFLRRIAAIKLCSKLGIAVINQFERVGLDRRFLMSLFLICVSAASKESSFAGVVCLPCKYRQTRARLEMIINHKNICLI